MASVTLSAPLGTDATAAPHGAAAPADRTGTGARRFRFELAPHPGSAAHARQVTRDRLGGWSVCQDTREAAELVVSELVTNAVVHTVSRRIVCELHDDAAGVVRIAVRDEGCPDGAPRPSAQQPEEEHGRGLLLVSAMCSAWGAQDTGPGLLVWAELPRQSDDRDRGARADDAGRTHTGTRGTEPDRTGGGERVWV